MLSCCFLFAWERWIDSNGNHKYPGHKIPETTCHKNKSMMSNLKFTACKHQAYLKCITLIWFAASSAVSLLSLKWCLSGNLLQMTLFLHRSNRPCNDGLSDQEYYVHTIMQSYSWLTNGNTKLVTNWFPWCQTYGKAISVFIK